MNFLTEHYANLKELNPKFRILVRDQAGREKPTLIAEYSFARKEFIDLSEFNSEQILERLKKCVEYGGTLKPVIPRPAYEAYVLGHSYLPTDIKYLPEELEIQKEQEQRELITEAMLE